MGIKSERLFKMEDKNIAFFEKEQFNKVQEYRFIPSPILQEYVKEFLIVDVSDLVCLETLPSTSVSLNYILNGSIAMKKKNDVPICLPKAFAFGIARTSLRFEFSKGTTLFVIIFNPGMASSIINTPINDFYEKFLSYDNFLNPNQLSYIEQIFANHNDYNVLIEKIEKFLLVEILCMQEDDIIKKALYEIINKQGSVSIKKIIDKLPVSRDSFEKKFRKQVGTSPKKFSNIVRFRNLFENKLEKATLTEIGLNAGYYDQSHFIKDFKVITGKKPSNFL
ncbi:AraC family transcriptional regulator [Sphingobacterium bovistauri]|uniref:AraC family transcriptional regulator n=1 Tax=Sphingobacterium bovistauri TaxID=2781959 RepID=A0ABS7Z7X2_9SPHI|nr:AraC family transcriptional regulator [Sphingobacterium bovistauri]MCA5006293.1 AraC family transcriptional regulator [Sphingobacterium bovistauri]